MKLIQVGNKTINMDLVAYVAAEASGLYVAFAAPHGGQILSLRFEGTEAEQLHRWLERHTESALQAGNGND